MSEKISLPLLTNNNYSTWKVRMQMLLVRDDWWFAVDEAKPNPVTAVWKTANQKALATIVLCLSDNQMNLVKDAASARDAWTKLKQYHEKSTMTSRVSLLKRICSLNLTEGREMEKHLFELEELFDRLQCAGQELEKSLKVAMILRSLPDSYDGLVTALEGRKDDELTIELVKQKLLDEWQRRSERLEHTGESSDEKALKMHTKRLEAKQEERTCFHCGKPGHFKRNCRLFKRQQQREKDEEDSVAKVKQVSDGRSTICFTVGGGSQKKGRWFVDSGCTTHMTNDRSFFDKLDESVRVDVMLADGSQAKSAGVGQGILKCLGSDGKPKDILVKDVMYVPDLCSGLLSVRKLTKKGFTVQFKASKCEIIGPMGKIVAVGELRDELYELKMEETVKIKSGSRRQPSCQLAWNRSSCEAGPAVLSCLGQGCIQEELQSETNFGCVRDLKLETSGWPHPRWHGYPCARGWKCACSHTYAFEGASMIVGG